MLTSRMKRSTKSLSTVRTAFSATVVPSARSAARWTCEAEPEPSKRSRRKRPPTTSPACIPAREYTGMRRGRVTAPSRARALLHELVRRLDHGPDDALADDRPRGDGHDETFPARGARFLRDEGRERAEERRERLVEREH